MQDGGESGCRGAFIADVRNKCAPPQFEIGRIAARQHGVVTLAQLEAVGLTRSSVARRVRDGHLLSVHRGVYAVGHDGLSRGGRWMAAVLALGPDAALSHMSAAALWGLLRPENGPIDVSLPSHSGRRRRAGIRVHRCASLRADEVTERHRIPVTTPARTIEDLRGTAPPHLVRRATRQAELAGYALGPRATPDGTRSDLERDFLRFCRRHGLPAPEVNGRVGRWTVDFLWREQRVAVETDSLAYHRGSVAFEDDHDRDLGLRERGFDLQRFTGRQIAAESERVADALRAALS